MFTDLKKESNALLILKRKVVGISKGKIPLEMSINERDIYSLNRVD